MANISSKALRLDRNRNNLIAEVDIGEDLPGSLVDEWRAQLVKYANYWQWMDGQVWETVDMHANIQRGKAPPVLFPVQLNPLYTAAMIHRNTLFGEVPDTGVPLVKPRAIPKRWGMSDDNEDGLKASKKNAQFVTDLLDMVLYQSNSRSMMMDAGFVSQAIGGTVIKVAYEPWNTTLQPGLPVAFRQIEPEYFLPIYSMHDRWHLLEGRLGRMIDGYEAKHTYGVDVNDRDRVLYLESWTRDEVRVTVDGKPAYINRNGVDVALSSEHKFGFVPFVYIPHETVGQFYGVPIVHELANLLKEYNGRVADVGDAVRNSIERLIVLTNADPGDLKIQNLDSGIRVLATGREMSGTQGKKVDLVGSVDLPRGTSEYIDFLKTEVWHAMFTPAVAYGEDEGSQRSALTLAFRMWPLTAHIRGERSLWTEGWRVACDYALRILRSRQVGQYGDMAKGTPWRVENEHLGHMISMDWAPMIPRDRESEINQLILRHQDEQLSAEGAMEKSGDIQDIQEELKRISEEREDRLKTEAKYAVKTDANKGPATDTQQPVGKVETD
jgi:hypothetical protein